MQILISAVDCVPRFMSLYIQQPLYTREKKNISDDNNNSTP